MADINVSRAIPINTQAAQAIQKAAGAEQIESDDSLSQYLDISVFNPMQQAQRFRNLKDLHSHLTHKMEEVEEPEEKMVLEVEKVEEAAARYQKNNFEMNAQTLRILKTRILSTDTPEEALDKVLKVYSDPALADEALDFLIETADEKTVAIVRAAKERFNADAGRAREIKAGRNMGAMAREFSKEGLGSATSLRDLYREITGNPREPLKLFDELSDQFRYPKLKPIITFLLHSLGSDLKSKGPSISAVELKRLIDETRSLQGMLGIFRFFQSRMRLIQRMFQQSNLMLPPKLDFEILAKVLVKLLSERYMNPEKILQTARLLGISEELAAQLILYSQMLDALKQIAPRYYRNQQHRDELRKAFIDTLDKLEDDLEEEKEEEEKK
ncbi:MAG TPA: HrpJ domain-containing protein [Chlamydiales bacterium]|nr:HrpJ domain-containing protein [Chlamydiales bacterium]